MPEITFFQVVTFDAKQQNKVVHFEIIDNLFKANLMFTIRELFLLKK